LHPEELRRDEVPELAVPRRARVQARIGTERSRQGLVHADGDAQVVITEPDGGGGGRERARGRRAGVVDVGGRGAGGAAAGDGGGGFADLVAPGEGELNVAPLDIGVRQGPADGDGAHVDARDAWEAPERVQPPPDDGALHVCPLAGTPAAALSRRA